MKKIILPLVAVAALSGCNTTVNNNPKPSAGIETVTEPNYEGVAWDAYMNLPEKDVLESFRSKALEKKGDLVFSGFNQVGEEGAEESFVVRCFPKSDGTFLVVYLATQCFDFCSTKVLTYSFDGDKLTELKSSPLPVDRDLENYVLDPFLILGFEEDFNNLKKDLKTKPFDEVCNYEFYGDTLTASIKAGLLGYNEQYYGAFKSLFFKWNKTTEQFDAVDVPEKYTGLSFNIIKPDRLGGIVIGQKPPTEISGFFVSHIGNKYYYSKDGTKFFAVLVDKDENAEAIDVMTSRYSTYDTKIGDPLANICNGATPEEINGEFVFTAVSPLDARNCIRFSSSKSDGNIEKIRIFVDKNAIDESKVAEIIFEQLITINNNAVFFKEKNLTPQIKNDGKFLSYNYKETVTDDDGNESEVSKQLNEICFKNNDGSWQVFVKYISDKESVNEIKEYVFKNQKLETVSNSVLPDIVAAKKLLHVGSSVETEDPYFDIDENGLVIELNSDDEFFKGEFKWNGENWEK
ncbi:MAG: membrane lipoprotein lipid attachment site-containing protein [Bacteroidales bacterium]|nr:membrane lipoprotein lipid attachment site-containing protein [Bacteroidales bacterium]